MTSHSSIKLTYFGIPGRADAIRLTFAVGGVLFENHIVSESEWAALKPSMPFGQVPLLTVDGTTQFAQSTTILRFAGQVAGLYPTDDLVKAALIDQLVMHIYDMISIYSHARLAEDDAVVAAIHKRLAENTFPRMLRELDALIARHSGGTWAVGESITIADLFMFSFFKTIREGVRKGMPTTLFDESPHILKSMDAVATHPRVVEWFATH
ncbi:hypothetical protein HK105_203554 [Polyrhizophydium stewartii]|uniref:Glutathione S-transferase n=1 Tax=Polyrhizophydium stewartii TaxID=2732419 RepID=A0ABR4NB55_9FUNG